MEYLLKNNWLKFSDYEQRITYEINKRGEDLWITEPNSLLRWFIKINIRDNLDDWITFWWPNIPIIAVVWNKSWRIYFFALKAILPEININ